MNELQAKIYIQKLSEVNDLPPDISEALRVANQAFNQISEIRMYCSDKTAPSNFTLARVREVLERSVK